MSGAITFLNSQQGTSSKATSPVDLSQAVCGLIFKEHTGDSKWYDSVAMPHDVSQHWIFFMSVGVTVVVLLATRATQLLVVTYQGMLRNYWIRLVCAFTRWQLHMRWNTDAASSLTLNVFWSNRPVTLRGFWFCFAAWRVNIRSMTPSPSPVTTHWVSAL